MDVVRVKNECHTIGIVIITVGIFKIISESLAHHEYPVYTSTDILLLLL